MLYWVRAFALLATFVFAFGFSHVAAQDPPEPVTPVNVVDRVADTVARLNATTAQVKAHRFTPPYFEEPCAPTKTDAEMGLSPYRAARRAYQQEIQQLKQQIIALEAHGANRNIMAEKGWKLFDQGRFRTLDTAYRLLNQAIAAKEAELDAIPVQPCRPKTQPAPPVAAGPTQADADLLKDDPLPPPIFDDPLTPPALPASFCSFTERNRFLQDVFWPFHERAKNNAVKAIAHMTNLERRRNEIAYADGSGSPRHLAAEAFVTAWEPIKRARMKAHADALALHDRIMAIPIIDCEPKTDQPALTPGTTPVPATPPPADATPPVPLPDGVVRPTMLTVPEITLPERFCSEKAKLDFLVDVYHPAAATASRNAVEASAYALMLSDLALTALNAGHRDLFNALTREREAFEPILKAAEALARRYREMRERILAIPVVDCTGRKRPPPLVEPARPVGDLAPPTDKPRLPPPNLRRPQMERVRALSPPRSFCDEFERNAYLENVYKPAAAAARANADTTRAHLTRLQAMFNDYMKNEGGPGWAAVRKELEEYKPIADAAYQDSLRMQQQYQAILAIPVVPCRERPEWKKDETAPTPPVDDGPGLEELIIPARRIPSLPEPICDEAERILAAERLRKAREAADRDARLIADRRALLEAGKANGTLEVSSETLETLIIQATRVDADRRALDAAEAKLKATRTQNCAPPADAAPKPPPPKPPADPAALPPAQPVFRDFVVPAYQDRFCSRAEAEAYLRRLEALLGEIREERDRFETHVALTYSAFANTSQPANSDVDEFGLAMVGMTAIGDQRGENLSQEMLAAYGRAYRALGADGSDRLWRYDQQVRTLENMRRVALTLLSEGFKPFDCPDPPTDATAPPPAAPPPAGDPPTTGVLPDRPKKPCPPKQGRKPINVGPNNKVGSGAQLQKKLGGMLVGGLLGAAGVGGGGGGGGGPQLYTCRIKDSEKTLFTHPSGLAIKVGAKRGKGDTVNVFTEIAKSPDKGTFQTAFLEKPPSDLGAGQVQAPFDVGPCDLWGEWELTVSWTKTTYVDGQMVSQESGGWSEGGKFNLPGMLSKVDAPDGMWKRMGFSSASHGAREAFMAFRVPQGGGPHTFVVHITQPKGNPVMTVPFVMTMVETAPGVFAFTQVKTEEDCPPVPADRVFISDGAGGPRLPLAANPAAPDQPREAPLPPPDLRTTPPTPPPVAGKAREASLPPPDLRTTPPTPPPVAEKAREAPLPPPDLRTTTPPPAPLAAADGTIPFTIAPLKEISSLAEYNKLAGPTMERLLDLRVLVEKAAEACAAGVPPVRGEPGWAEYAGLYRKLLSDFLDTLVSLDPVGPEAQAILDARMGNTVSTQEMIREFDARPPPTCPPRLPDDPGPPESILDDVDDVRPLG